ncbi:thiol-disulfide isomerase [Pseudomonas sp. CrR14]|nr:thiol-disulfide isomerase [Pseudomonas sp. CrR14]
MAHSRHTSLPGWLITAACLAVVGAALWWFDARYLRPFDERTTLFGGTALRLPATLAGPGEIRLVHFWDPACPCNVGNQQHLAELVGSYSARGVSFHVVQKPGSHGQSPETLSGLQPLTGLTGSDHLPASPAVAIWDQHGKLAYFGPYGSGLSCSSGNSFIEPVLDALLAGRTVTADNNLASGCFCDWVLQR